MVLQVPLLENSEALRQWAESSNSTLQQLPDAVQKGYAKAQSMLEARREAETSVDASRPADTDLLAAYIAYIKLEEVNPHNITTCVTAVFLFRLYSLWPGHLHSSTCRCTLPVNDSLSSTILIPNTVCTASLHTSLIIMRAAPSRCINLACSMRIGAIRSPSPSDNHLGVEPGQWCRLGLLPYLSCHHSATCKVFTCKLCANCERRCLKKRNMCRLLKRCQGSKCYMSEHFPDFR